MAHAEKYKRNNVVGLAIHYERREGCKLTNQSIDTDKSYLNYNLAQEIQPLKPEQFISKRLNEVKHINRKDIVVMVDWIVTLPKNVPATDEKSFFQLVYQFIKECHGEINIVCAWVHNDETTPHIHVSFVPVIKEDGIEKLNCKKLLTKTMLKQFHPSLGRFLEQSLGYLPEIQNGATNNGNRTIKELKNKEDISLKKSLSNIYEHIRVSEAIVEKSNDLDFEVSGLLEKTKTLKKSHEIIDELKHNNKQLKNDTKSLVDLVSVQKKELNIYREIPLSTRLDEKQVVIDKLCSSIKQLEHQINKQNHEYQKLEKTKDLISTKVYKLEKELDTHKGFLAVLDLSRSFEVFKRNYKDNKIDIHILKDICSKAYSKIAYVIDKILSRITVLNKKQLPTEKIKVHHKKSNLSIEEEI